MKFRERVLLIIVNRYVRIFNLNVFVFPSLFSISIDALNTKNITDIAYDNYMADLYHNPWNVQVLRAQTCYQTHNEVGYNRVSLPV